MLAVAGFVVFFALVFGGTLGVILLSRKYIIPSGSIGVTTESVYQAGTPVYSFSELKLYDLSPVVHTIATNYGSFAVSWRPDPQNIRALIKAGDEEGVLAKVQQILLADPKADLKRHEAQLGVTFIDTPKIEVPPDPAFFNPVAELEDINQRVQTLQDLMKREREFYRHHRDILDDPYLAEQTRIFFDELRARITGMR